MSNMLADPSHWQLVERGTGAVIAGPPAPNWNGAGYSPVPDTLLVGLIPQGAWLAGDFDPGASAWLVAIISPELLTSAPTCETGTPIGIFESTGYQVIDLSAYEGQYVYLGITEQNSISCAFASAYYGALDVSIPSATALATIEVTGCSDCTPTLQPPGSGRNTPVVRTSERNGLTVFFPGETDRKCVQGTCPMPVCSDPAPDPDPGCAEVVLTGDADLSESSFTAPGFEWGETAYFMLAPPGEGQEFVFFEWDWEAERYAAGSSAGCNSGPTEGWTFMSGDEGAEALCAVVSAVCA